MPVAKHREYRHLACWCWRQTNWSFENRVNFLDSLQRKWF